MINSYYQFFMVKGGLDRRGICYAIRKQVATMGTNWLRWGHTCISSGGEPTKVVGEELALGKNLHEQTQWVFKDNSMNFIMLLVQISPLQSNLPITKTDDFDKGCQTLGLISPVLRAWTSSSLRFLQLWWYQNDEWVDFICRLIKWASWARTDTWWLTPQTLFLLGTFKTTS